MNTICVHSAGYNFEGACSACTSIEPEDQEQLDLFIEWLANYTVERYLGHIVREYERLRQL
jgi:hypothetical protein